MRKAQLQQSCGFRTGHKPARGASGGITVADLHQDWLACMRKGDFAGAWAVNAAVLAGQTPETRDDPRLPYHLRWVWDGRPVAGRHVLVRCYHGLGDTLQFARFLPALAAQAASVVVECQPGLVPLLAGVPGIHRLIPFDVAAPMAPAECDIEIMELAFALRLRPDAVPLPTWRAPAPARLPPGTLGLCWTVGDWDKAREVPPALLAPLAARTAKRADPVVKGGCSRPHEGRGHLVDDARCRDMRGLRLRDVARVERRLHGADRRLDRAVGGERLRRHDHRRCDR